MVFEPRRRSFHLADGEMAAIDFGDPRRPVDVVFLHANGFSASTYRGVLAPLALRVLAIDQRGHGRTRLPADPARLADWGVFAADLTAIVKQLGQDAPVVLAGHSLGGTTALLAAPDLGERVAGLALFDPVLLRRRDEEPSAPDALIEGALRRRRLFDSRPQAVEAYVGRGAFKTWPREVIADYLEDGLRETGGGLTLACAPEWEAAVFAAQGSDPWAALDRLNVPLSIWRAEHGSTCLLDETHPNIAGRADRRAVTVAGTSHFLPMERPDVVREGLLEMAG